LPAKLDLLWTFKTEGPVKSSAAIVQGKVFIGSDDGNVYALSLSDGKKVWAHKTGGPVESSPLCWGDSVFFGSSDNFLYALDAASGKQHWKYETGDRVLGAPNAVISGGSNRWVLVGSYDFQTALCGSEFGQKQLGVRISQLHQWLSGGC
jgi:outer membrane protein assembly factor BamB